MDKITAFDRFAPAILQVYHRNKEAFWAAVMAPFLASNISLWDWFRHLKVDVGLLAAFKGLDDEARLTLKDFSTPLELDITAWHSNRLQYFKDAYPSLRFWPCGWTKKACLTSWISLPIFCGPECLLSPGTASSMRTWTVTHPRR